MNIPLRRPEPNHFEEQDAERTFHWRASIRPFSFAHELHGELMGSE
jgi:hypothetical protein